MDRGVSSSGCSVSPPSPSHSLENSGLPDCPFCFNTLGTNGGPASLPCGHNGCLDCLKTWLQNTPQCAMCRQSFSASISLGQNIQLKDALDTLKTAKELAVSAQEQLMQQQEQLKLQQKMQQYSTPSEGLYPPMPPQKSWSVNSSMHPSGQGMGQDPLSTPQGRPGPTPLASDGVVRGMLSLVSGKSRARDQFWNANTAGATVGGNSLATPSAPPLVYPSMSVVDRFQQEMGFGRAEGVLSPVQGVLEAEPPKWVPDSASPTCMRCSNLFRPILCMRHHCRFCGHLVCDACSRGRALLPRRFRESEPQRVCDYCFEVVFPVQKLLVATVSPAVQTALHDVTDCSSARAWVNSPWGTSMEDEVYKATNMLREYAHVGSLNPEKAIPGVVLNNARGLALLTMAKAGAGLSYKLGSGLVISRRPDGSWSAPTAIAIAGFSWGAQVGGEIVDMIVVLRTVEALKAFCGNYHVAVGASMGAAVGPVGRNIEGDVRAGRQGLSMAYTYSCSKGAYVGVAMEYSVIKACHNTNMRYYGSPDCRPADILFGNFPQPNEARPLYAALDDLFRSVQDQQQQLRASREDREGAEEEDEGRFEVSDAMAAAESMAVSASAAVQRFFDESGAPELDGEVSVESVPRNVEHSYRNSQQPLGFERHRDEAGVSESPPPYDAFYSHAPACEDRGPPLEWEQDVLPMMAS